MYCNVYNPYYNTELYHHGILGMKWGVRRWQYEDGSWTPEGRKRYSTSGVKYRGLDKLSANIGESYADLIRSKKENPGTIGKIRNYAAMQTENWAKNDANMRNFIFGREYDKNIMRWHVSTTGAGIVSGLVSGTIGSIALTPVVNAIEDPALKTAVMVGGTVVSSIIGGAAGYQAKKEIERRYDNLHEYD